MYEDRESQTLKPFKLIKNVYADDVRTARTPVSLSDVAGQSARAIRRSAGATLEDIAKAARHYGLKWSANKVNSFEAGGVSPTLSTLYAVAAALGDVTGQPVKLADLFAGQGKVVVNDRLTVDIGKVRSAVTDKPIVVTLSELTGERARAVAAAEELRAMQDSWPPALRIKRPLYRAVLAEFSDSDLRLARSLGVDRSTAAAAMAAVWGMTFVARRDELAGPDANAQKRGRIARELKEELRKVLE